MKIYFRFEANGLHILEMKVLAYLIMVHIQNVYARLIELSRDFEFYISKC